MDHGEAAEKVLGVFDFVTNGSDTEVEVVEL